MSRAAKRMRAVKAPASVKASHAWLLPVAQKNLVPVGRFVARGAAPIARMIQTVGPLPFARMVRAKKAVVTIAPAKTVSVATPRLQHAWSVWRTKTAKKARSVGANDATHAPSTLNVAQVVFAWKVHAKPETVVCPKIAALVKCARATNAKPVAMMRIAPTARFVNKTNARLVVASEKIVARVRSVIPHPTHAKAAWKRTIVLEVWFAQTTPAPSAQMTPPVALGSYASTELVRWVIVVRPPTARAAMYVEAIGVDRAQSTKSARPVRSV